MKSFRLFPLLLSAAVLATPIASHAADEHGAMHAQHAQADIGAGAASAAANTASEGEVKKVDKSVGKLTIKHGELKNLDMPPMTMIFRVKDGAMLEQVKPGDRIRFVAEKIDGKLTVTRIEGVQ